MTPPTPAKGKFPYPHRTLAEVWASAKPKTHEQQLEAVKEGSPLVRNWRRG